MNKELSDSYNLPIVIEIFITLAACTYRMWSAKNTVVISVAAKIEGGMQQLTLFDTGL